MTINLHIFYSWMKPRPVASQLWQDERIKFASIWHSLDTRCLDAYFMLLHFASHLCAVVSFCFHCPKIQHVKLWRWLGTELYWATYSLCSLHLEFYLHNCLSNFTRLVGDMKYNPDRFEHDCAVVPRIFLHCLRMEFQDWINSRMDLMWSFSFFLKSCGWYANSHGDTIQLGFRLVFCTSLCCPFRSLCQDMDGDSFTAASNLSWHLACW